MIKFEQIPAAASLSWYTIYEGLSECQAKGRRMDFPRSQQGYGYAGGFGHSWITAPFDNAGLQFRWENAGCNVIYLKRGGLGSAALTHQFGEPSDKED
jgi:hypothetical protein